MKLHSSFFFFFTEARILYFTMALMHILRSRSYLPLAGSVSSGASENSSDIYAPAVKPPGYPSSFGSYPVNLDATHAGRTPCKASTQMISSGMGLLCIKKGQRDPKKYEENKMYSRDTEC